MEFSRRLFLGGSLALSAARFTALDESIPTIYGDLIHDDAPGVSALLSGRPSRVLTGRAVQGVRPILTEANLLLRTPIVLDGAKDVTLLNSTLTTAPGFDGENLIECVRCENLLLSGIHFDARNIPFRATAPGVYAYFVDGAA